MKKLFTLLALLAVASVQAQTDYYGLPGYQTQQMMTSFTPGEPIVMQPFRADTCMFYNGEHFYPYGYSFQVDNRGLFTFEEAGEDADGYMTYFMKNYVTGLYLRDCAYGDGNVDVYYDQKTTARAQRVYVFPTQNYWKVGGRAPANRDNRWCATYTGDKKPDNTFIISMVDNPGDRSIIYLSSTIWSSAEAGCHFNSDLLYNTWYFWRPEKLTGRARLEATVGKTYGNNDGEFNITYLPRANWQLSVPQKLKDEARSLYAEAKAILADAAVSEADCEAEAIKVQTTYDNYLQQGVNNYNARAAEFAFLPQYYAGFTFTNMPIARNIYVEPSLVTDPTKIWTDAASLANDNDVSNLIDGDPTHCFFVGGFSDRPGEYYGVSVDLGREVQDLTFKFTYRNEGMGPTNMHVYGSDNGTDWKTEGWAAFRGQYPGINVNGEERADLMGMSSVHLTRPYRYLRLECEGTMWGNVDNSGNYIWQLGELQFYETPIDYATSLNSVMNADTLNYLAENLALLNAQLGDSVVSSEQLAAFSEAAERYAAAFPAKSRVESRIAYCQQLHDAAIEDPAVDVNLGLYRPGAKAEFLAVIDEVRADIAPKSVMTMAEVNTELDKLNAALDVFSASINKPIDGHYYYIKNVPDYAPTANQFLNAPDSDPSQIVMGGYDPVAQTEDPNLSIRLNYFWRAIDLGNGLYAFQNAATGTYMGSQSANDECAVMSLTDEGVGIRLLPSSPSGAFRFQFQTGTYAVSEGNYNTLISLTNPDRLGNSAYLLEDVTEAWAQSSWLDCRKPRLLTLPYAVEGDFESQTFVFSGYNAATNTLEFAELASPDVIEAGTPFLVVPKAQVSDAEVTGLELMPTFLALDDAQYTSTPQVSNGLHGVITSVENNGYVALNFAGTEAVVMQRPRIAANSAYLSDLFNPDVVPQVSEAGDVSIAVSDAVTGVLTPTRNQKAAVTYDLQGRRVQNAAKGVYIRGTQKVLVK